MVELCVAVIAWTMFHRHGKHLSPSFSVLVSMWFGLVERPACVALCVHEFMYDAFSVYANNNEFCVRGMAMALAMARQLKAE